MKTTALGLLVLVSIVSSTCAFAGNARHPFYSGKFYPEEKKKLQRVIEKLKQRADQKVLSSFSGKNLKGLVMPHAGYIYSGQTASYAALLLDDYSFGKVILIGPDHTTGFSGSVINCADHWRTPMGSVAVHDDAGKLADTFSFFTPKTDSFLGEHSLEVILPFLQSSINNFSIVPIVAGRTDIGETAKAIESIVDDDTLIIASSDLSHFLSYADAKKQDGETINTILNFEIETLLKARNTACGRIPVGILLTIAKKRGWTPYLVHYSNSGDTAGDKNRVVGYCTIAFFDEGNHQVTGEFSRQDGDVLVELARITIARKLGITIDKNDKETIDKKLQNNCFSKKRGTFVTLHKNNRLRGCIGNLSPGASVKEGVKDNALNAAFRDPRFSELTKSEFEDIAIEVSILSTPKKLNYSGPEDLLNKLRPGIDGVIIKRGFNRATYLPQVWDQLPVPEEFLSRLCRKAGLSGNEWKKGTVTVMTYQAQYFE